MITDLRSFRPGLESFECICRLFLKQLRRAFGQFANEHTRRAAEHGKRGDHSVGREHGAVLKAAAVTQDASRALEYAQQGARRAMFKW